MCCLLFFDWNLFDVRYPEILDLYIWLQPEAKIKQDGYCFKYPLALSLSSTL